MIVCRRDCRGDGLRRRREEMGEKGVKTREKERSIIILPPSQY